MKRKLSLFPSKIILLLLGIGVLGLGFILFQNKFLHKTSPFQLYQKTVSLQRKWDFKVLSFSLIEAAKTNQIYIKNKPVRTTSDKAFLVLNLELRNETDKRVYFYSSDLVRLVTSEGKKFEADFKNPRLEIAPLSTKKDKLAFLVEADRNDFQIQIGEITGEKETININF